VTCWTAGFDIIYSCQDYEFDVHSGLYSIPARFGIGGALWISRLLHVTMIACLATLVTVFHLGWLSYAGIAAIVTLLPYEHNLVRVTYFTVNRHINPTDVCVASCRLCAFGKRVRDPKAYTMSLDEVWTRAAEGWTESITEFHIVGGLHPELTLDWYCEMLRGLKARFPQVHLKAFT